MAKLDFQMQIKKTIKPSITTHDHPRILKLSVYDQMPQRVYVPMLLYYLPSSEHKYNSEEITERCDKLQKSLADTLAANFYPIAGRFRDESFSIDCNDEGVVYVETKINAILAEFLHDGPKLELLDDLLPWGVNPPDTSLPTSPLLGVQVNIFNCGGLVIGIQLSHLLGDSYTMATFLKEWARAGRTGTTEGCLSSYGHLAELYPPKPLPNLTPPPFEDVKIVTRRFMFDASSIAKLKDIIDSSGATYTKYVAVRALIWKVLAIIATAKHGHPRNNILVIPIYLRSKSNLPTLQHALGTFALSTVAYIGENQSRKELSEFAKSVASAMASPSIRIGYDAIDAIYNQDNAPDGPVVDVDYHVCINWGGFPLYEADFGWGKPFWVSTVNQNDVELIALFDTRDGEGIEAWINLKEDEMAAFEKDPDILTFSPPAKRQLIPQLG